jgi:hypothetical protein
MMIGLGGSVVDVWTPTLLDPPETTTMKLKHDKREPVPEWLTRLNPEELGPFAGILARRLS